MDNYPLISIGIPVIKANFLKEAINCALQQTYPNVEIIILNNAKDDKVKLDIEGVVKSLNSDKLNYYVNDQQLPIIENWNKVLSYAKGDFFSILCDDDLWDETFLIEIYKLSIKYSHANVFHARAAIMDDNNNFIRLSPICNEHEDALEFFYERIKYLRAHFLSDFVIRTDALKRINGFHNITTGWGSDDLTWLKLASVGGIAYTSEILFYYRESAINISNTLSLKSKIASLDEFTIAAQELLNTLKPTDRKAVIIYELILNEIQKFKVKHLEMFWRSFLKLKYKNKHLANLIFRVFRNRYLKP